MTSDLGKAMADARERIVELGGELALMAYELGLDSVTLTACIEDCDDPWVSFMGTVDERIYLSCRCDLQEETEARR